MNSLFHPFSRVFLVVVHGLLFVSMVHASDDVNAMQAIPAPNDAVVQPGEHRLGKPAIRCASRELVPESKMLKEKLSRMGISSSLTTGQNARDGITLKINGELKRPESYRLVIGSESIMRRNGISRSSPK